MSKYAFSIDGERYYSATGEVPEEIIKNIINDGELEYNFKNEGFANVYIGEQYGYNDNGSDCYDVILDHFSEAAYEHGGEYAEDYLSSVSKEGEKYLKEQLDKIWKEFKKIGNIEATFFNIQSYKIFRVEIVGSFEEIMED
ncbi:hypothetical protein [Cetobacterium somerae]